MLNTSFEYTRDPILSYITQIQTILPQNLNVTINSFLKNWLNKKELSIKKKRREIDYIGDLPTK